MPDPLELAPHDPAHTPLPRRRHWWIAVVVLAILGAGLYVWNARRTAAPGRTGPAAQAGREAQAPPVSVGAAAVSRRDVPLDLEGLGNVVAYKTVTVRSQVDGRLMQVLFQEGQAVKQGQSLAQIDPRPFQIQLEQAQGALARDTAQLASARRDLERYKSLAAEKLIAQQQADAQVATVGQLEGAVRIDQAAVDAAKLNLDYAHITSPVDGVTGLRLVDPGNVVHASDAGGLVIVTQLEPIAVLFTLPQDQLSMVAEAMARGPLAVEVFGREGTTPLGSGKLELVDNQINAATSTIRLKAVLPNPRHVLWPNQFVKVRLRVSVDRGALVVPATALQRGPSGTFVYVIAQDSTAEPRPVEIASMQGDTAIVAKGLSEGEKVVVDGQARLRTGSKVDVTGAGGHAGTGGQGPGGGQGTGGKPGTAQAPGERPRAKGEAASR